MTGTAAVITDDNVLLRDSSLRADGLLARLAQQISWQEQCGQKLGFYDCNCCTEVLFSSLGVEEAIRRIRQAGADAGGTGWDSNIDGSEPQVILTSSGQKLPFQEVGTLCKVDSSFVKITLEAPRLRRWIKRSLSILKEKREEILEKNTATVAEVLQPQGDAHMRDIKNWFYGTEVVLPIVRVWSNLT
jgi:hypothetical protein